ncbi:hypothetical protein AOL_s00004g165 [Orbilia oligospora ATCC 24927]|uniref:F-box domain-containing protein n=1 Tax=Arthrobotrys oligospora (strain ATCC 24927 / CBS 115.81 / DSM 1491) TaxID=756982 RepID=G1WY05_ARTOA|nr:hypothetical protein AOL_s00004g165 [Orbilia oligospora ATCC 24927]EGX54132.1 hypothetical protein AOL_s00004g165 [Orbilia oligospora ATCC 24927]
MNAIPPILALPNEILAKIFGDNDLSDVDISRSIQVCKLFKENIQKFVGQKLTFAVDDISHSGWRFARCLLRNPEIGEHFANMTVEWHRRNWSDWKIDKEHWTKDWAWTGLEREKISALCKKWDINEKTKSIILGGKNSEALLPLLLCLTPNLKSLDLGEVDLSLVDLGTQAYRPGGETYSSALKLLSCEFDEDGDDDDDDRDYHRRNYNYRVQTAYYNCLSSYQPLDHSLFFFDNLRYKANGDIVGPKTLLPGLANLEFFKIAGPKNHKSSDELSLHQSECFLILLLPRIQSVEILSTFSHWDSHEPLSDGPSTLKRLTFIRGFDDRWGPERVAFFEKMSKITSNLERLYINATFSMFDGDPARFFEPIARVFLQNIKCLESSNILVNGGGFNEMGEWNFYEERRREVARKQKAFELIRGKLQTLKPPPIVVTSNKIIPNVLKHLNRSGVFNLMLSCKALYDICYPDLWASLCFGGRYDREYPRPSVTAEASHRLVKSFELSGAGGLENLERLELGQGFYIAVDDSDRSPNEILSALANQIELGNTPKLSHLSLDWTLMVARMRPRVEDEFHDPASLRFYRTIKEYSQKKTPEEFRLSLVFNLPSPPKVDPTSLLDTRNLKDLEVLLLWDENLAMATLAANSLVDILSGSPNLENVTLRTWIGVSYQPRGEIKKGVKQLWEALTGLQTVIGGLKNLRSLSIIDALSIHPSFLLTPPPACRSVSYRGKTTTLWWEQFANFPFSGIERMTLECTELDTAEGKAMKRITGQEWTPVEKLLLGDVKVSTLRWLNISPPSGGLGKEIGYKGYPKDFIKCMLKKNIQLSDECLRPLASQIAISYRAERAKVMENVFSMQMANLKTRLCAALDTYAEDTALQTLRETRSIGEEFQSEMRNKPVDMLVQQFENELGPEFIAKCTETLRVQLREGRPPSFSNPQRDQYDSDDSY